MCACSKRNSSDGGGAGDGDDVDLISDLPEELIHSILIRLPSAAAARTSVLSRRWRHVWTRLPALSFTWDYRKPGVIGAALAAFSAPTVNRLAISARGALNSSNVAPWLGFASQRVAGNLTLNFTRVYDSLDLPICERATSINLHLTYHLVMPPAGSFAALTALTIIGARMQGGDFEALCSPRCPRLQRLKVRGVELVAADDVSIRSNSLEQLVFLVNGVGRLEVVAPRLRYFRATPKTIDNVSDAAGPGMLDANIAAPMLEDVAWYGVFNLLRHRFAEAGRRLQKLTVVDLPTAPLMRRFYVVDELVLHFGISPRIEGYKVFLNATSSVARCEVMDLQMTTRRHFFPSAVLHLLRKSTGVTKLLVRLPRTGNKSCTEGCPCSLPDSCKTDKILLDSLKEVEIFGFRGEVQHMKFINLLLECHAPILKKVYVKISKDVKSINKKTRKKICKIIDGHPDIDQFIVVRELADHASSAFGRKCRMVKTKGLIDSIVVTETLRW